MSLVIKNTSEVSSVGSFVASRILEQLKIGKKVLWFVPGGSAIAVAIEASSIIREYTHNNLIVTLTDERYGELGHKDSNWYQLEERGFILPGAKMIPVLSGVDIRETVKNFTLNLKDILAVSNYKIGLFGIGMDGHTAGILPESGAVEHRDLVYNYIAPPFERITITPLAISQLDEAVVYAVGENKWPVIQDLINREIDIHTQPAQILKQVPLLTIFSDYKN